MNVESVTKWVGQRLPVNQAFFETISSFYIPKHFRRWFFGLGEIPLILFLMQVITGICLVLFYTPTPEKAWISAANIYLKVPFGWWVKGIHHWCANFVIIAAFIHFFMVFFSGAYRKPRELSWFIGVLLLVSLMIFGWTGYSLVYNQTSYWAVVVGSNIAGQIPVVGEYFLYFMRGGADVGPQTLTRIFALHVGAMPVVLIFLIAFHIYLAYQHGFTRIEGDDVEEHDKYYYYPEHFLKLVGIFFVAVILLTQITIMIPPHMLAQADPFTAPLHVKPEWYFFAVFRWLKLAPLSFGVLSTVGLVCLLLIYPFLEKILIKVTKIKEISTFIGIIGALVYIGFTIWETLA